jgi:lysophospholipase L1-like esterase
MSRAAVASFVTLAAFVAVPAVSAVGATPSSSTVKKVAARSLVVHPNDRRIRYVGHWAVSSGAAVTVNSGSRLTFSFTGTRATATFDEAKVLLKPQIYVTVDGRSKLVTLDKPVVPLAAKLRKGKHTVAIDIKGIDAGGARWTPPLTTAVTLTSLDLGPGAKLLPLPKAAPLRFEFYGDSVTEGVKALGDAYTIGMEDATKAYPALVSRGFGADGSNLAFAGQGVTAAGLGGVGTAADSFGSVLAGTPATSAAPDAVVLHLGENDDAATAQAFTDGYVAYLAKIRKAYPKAWIFALRPFNGTHAADVTAAVTTAADPKIVDVDTTGWLPPTDTRDGTHPTAVAHRKLAALMVAAIHAKAGWKVANPKP